MSSVSFLPSTPPAALKSATAISAPFFNCRPNAEYSPVIGPATAIVRSSANAALDNAKDAPSASPISFSDFMRDPRGCSTRGNAGQAGSCNGVHCRLILRGSHRQFSGKAATRRPNLAARFGEKLSPTAALQIGGADFGPLQQFAASSLERDQPVDHDIAAMGELQCVVGVLLDDQHGKAILLV